MSSLRYGNKQGDGLRQKQSFVLYRFAQPVMRARRPRARKPAFKRLVIDSLPRGGSKRNKASSAHCGAPEALLKAFAAVLVSRQLNGTEIPHIIIYCDLYGIGCLLSKKWLHNLFPVDYV